MNQPIPVLLDVDQVLNADYPKGAGWEIVHRATVQSVERRRDYEIVWAPVAVQRLACLHLDGLIELVWCTTWCSEAHLLENLWSLPPLRRAIPGAPTPNGTAGNRAKLAAVQREVATGRPGVWVDDALPVIASRVEREALTAVCGWLLINPTPKAGISGAEIDAIELYARNAIEVPAA